ncbi:MAG: hypothetical protein QM493_04115 [Sulfurovum sp.]
MRLFITIALLSQYIFATPPNLQNSITLTHINDINLLGETSGVTTGDDRLTGLLDLEYKDEKSLYTLSLKSYTQRHIALGKRVDTLSFGYLGDWIQVYKEDYLYRVIIGTEYTQSGDFAGEGLQNAIHSITKNPQYNLPYSNKKHSTIGIAIKALGLYKITTDLSLYSNINIYQNIDKSNNFTLSIGSEYRYRNISLWIEAVSNYITPFAHSIVEYSTPDKQNNFLNIGASIKWCKRYQISIGTTIGGTPLGERDDYSSSIGFRYFL